MKEINENNDPSSRVVASRNLLNYTSIRFLRSNFSYYFSWQVFLGNIVPWTEHKFYTASSEFLCELCSARNCPLAWSCFILLYGHKVKCLLSPPSFPLHLSLTPSPRVPLRFPPPIPFPSAIHVVYESCVKLFSGSVDVHARFFPWCSPVFSVCCSLLLLVNFWKQVTDLRFSFECHLTNSKAITTTNQNERNYYKDSKWKQESAGKFIFSSVSTSRKMLAAPLILTPIDINMYAFFWVFFFRASCSHVSDSVNRPCMYDGFPGFAQFIFHWIVPDSRQVIILYVSYFNTDWAVRSAGYGNEVAQKSKSH